MSSQSEAALEKGLVNTLQLMSYEYVHPDMEQKKRCIARMSRALDRK